MTKLRLAFVLVWTVACGGSPMSPSNEETLLVGRPVQQNVLFQLPGAGAAESCCRY